MVRSLAQWTKTLSFPARISPNKSSKDNIASSPTVTPTPSTNSLSPHSTIQKNNEINVIMNNNVNNNNIDSHSSFNEVSQEI